MDFLTRFFTWWNGQTFGTQLWTSRFGELVGEDEYGNRYYRTKAGRIDPALGFERRWVIYKGLAEASTIGPAWHGWMHHTVRHPAHFRQGCAAPVVEAASAEPHRHARRLSADRLDARAEQAAQGDWRLQAVDAGALTFLRRAKNRGERAGNAGPCLANRIGRHCHIAMRARGGCSGPKPDRPARPEPS